METKLLGK